MAREFKARPVFEIINQNKGWVVQELDKLRTEWDAWLKVAEGLPVSPDYDPNTCAESIMDGRDNRRKHKVLREKTLVFIANNFSGYGFLFDDWPDHPHETNQNRLTFIIPGWIHRLETLAATIEYARVPEGYWKSKGKELVDEIVKVGPDKGIDVAASWLKNPFAGE
ncbi:MAG: hypothetical protein HQ513_02505 [Rhodospirillales bacterium]|nr:hypothetical protein [Rhodospirillales bacterium]